MQIGHIQTTCLSDAMFEGAAWKVVLRLYPAFPDVAWGAWVIGLQVAIKVSEVSVINPGQILIGVAQSIIVAPPSALIWAFFQGDNCVAVSEAAVSPC